MRIEKKIIPALYIPAHVKTTKIYEFDELADDIKKELREKESDRLDIDFIVDEWLESVKAIAELLGDNNPSYSIGYCNYDNHVSISHDGPEEVAGIRAMAWIQNNWIDLAYKGKYFSTPFKKCEKSPDHPAGITYKYRHSKIMLELDNCPFTGICWDYSFYDTWNEFKEGIRAGKQLAVDDFVEMLEDNLVKDVMKEIDYRYSEEGIDEELSQHEYYADGGIAC